MQDYSYCFLQDADNPFTSAKTLDILYLQKDSEKYIIPAFQGKGGHPVLLGKNVIDHIANHPADIGNLKEILKNTPKKKIELMEKSVLVNINTPEEYNRFFTDKID